MECNHLVTFPALPVVTPPDVLLSQAFESSLPSSTMGFWHFDLACSSFSQLLECIVMASSYHPWGFDKVLKCVSSKMSTKQINSSTFNLMFCPLESKKNLRIKSYLYFLSYWRCVLIRSLKIMFLSFIMRISKFPTGLCHNLTSVICLVCTTEKDGANFEGKHIVS